VIRGVVFLGSEAARVLRKSADDMIKEVITVIDERSSVSWIYCGDDQLLVVCDLFRDNLVNFNALLLAKLLGGALSVPEYSYGEGVHPIVYAHFRFSDW
jgi:hypothetical protein